MQVFFSPFFIFSDRGEFWGNAAQNKDVQDSLKNCFSLYYANQLSEIRPDDLPIAAAIHSRPQTQGFSAILLPPLHLFCHK